MHILVVEDERALCETIVRSLRRLAYSGEVPDRHENKVAEVIYENTDCYRHAE